MARAKQGAVRQRLDEPNNLRALVHEYFPATLQAFLESKALNSRQHAQYCTLPDTG
ncbi:hypothetical protein [Spelaeicoccus albus]|uniref:Uncharacterized protein n=1 Tax=Spelaeicoccus albus TaxID=1280376 RepID=A0A7Z0D4N7_9MICO|nr:hypothetical protein [Spelaeicoccus albus]NYI68783.1 hypothetical protein [Spelaeicoccus albus]